MMFMAIEITGFYIPTLLNMEFGGGSRTEISF
jgi:hypothetical protein